MLQVNIIKVGRILKIMLKGPMDVFQIQESYYQLHDKTIWLSTLYQILHALEKTRIIRGEFVDGSETPERGGCRKRFYELR